MFELLLLLLLVVVDELPGPLKELSDVVSRVVRLSFLTGAVDNVGDTNGDASGLNSIRGSLEGFLEVVGVLKALVVRRGLLLRTSKYFWVIGVAVSFPFFEPSGRFISLIL